MRKTLGKSFYKFNTGIIQVCDTHGKKVLSLPLHSEKEYEIIMPKIGILNQQGNLLMHSLIHSHIQPFAEYLLPK